MSRTQLAIGLALILSIVVLVLAWSRSQRAAEARIALESRTEAAAPAGPRIESVSEVAKRTEAEPTASEKTSAPANPSHPAEDALASGTVFDEVGGLVPYASVTAHAADASWFDPGSVSLRSDVASDGSFRITGTLDAPRIELQALTRDGRESQTIVVARGASGVRLVLPRCGSLELHLLVPGDPPIMDFRLSLSRSGSEPARSHVTIEAVDGQWGGSIRFDRLGADDRGYGIRVPCLDGGDYSLVASLSQDRTPLLTFDGIHVSVVESSRDPRLSSIDLRAFVHPHALIFVDPEGKSIQTGTIEFADPLSPAVHFRHGFLDGSPRFLSRSPTIEVHASSPGFLGASIQVGEAPQQIVLSRGIPVQVRVSGIAMPKSPSRLRIACIPAADDARTISGHGSAWMMSADVFKDPALMQQIWLVGNVPFIHGSDVEETGLGMLTVSSTGEYVLRAYLLAETADPEQLRVTEVPLDPLPHVMIQGGALEQVVNVVIDPKWLEKVQSK